MSQLIIQNARWIAANLFNKVHFSFLQILQILVVKLNKNDAKLSPVTLKIITDPRFI